MKVTDAGRVNQGSRRGAMGKRGRGGGLRAAHPAAARKVQGQQASHMAHMPQTGVRHVLTAGKADGGELQALQMLQLAVMQLWNATKVKVAQ